MATISANTVVTAKISDVTLKVDWKEWQPFQSMISAGKATEEEMVNASESIVAVIIEEANSGREFRDSYKTMCDEMCKHGRLGFADSEGHALLDNICRQLWKQAATDWIGEW